MAPTKNSSMKAQQANETGKRPVKVANCSGYAGMLTSEKVENFQNELK
jgi:hypothetical protein